jgi:D-alanine-D-alanine ligase
MPKLRIGLLFGGRSVEHEVSLASAASILRALDPDRYDVALISIDHDGRWRLRGPELPPEVGVAGAEVSLPAMPSERTLVSVADGDIGATGHLDVVFPIVHGRGGEDGSLQGLFELAGIPYVGSGVLGSAVQMDKEVSKRLLHAAGLPVVPWTSVRGGALRRDPEATRRRVLAEISPPLFVKPSNLGSSVGISRVASEDELDAALAEAARYDDKILVECAVDARELEVALLGNDPIEASVPGEIRTGHTFYDYEAKYVDDDTELLVPAPVSEEQSAALQRLAIAAVEVVEGRGLARVDFLMDRESGEIFVNEVNSLPGFTAGSMYPRLWEASGVPYPTLIDRLIELALESHRERSRLETFYRRE